MLAARHRRDGGVKSLAMRAHAVGCGGQHCAACEHGLEQYCEEHSTLTYDDIDCHDHMPTFGGYPEKIIELVDAENRAPLIHGTRQVTGA